MTSARPPKPLFVTVGDNPVRAFAMGAAERADALATKAGLEPTREASEGRSTVYADLNWTWDPEWLVALADTSAAVLTKDGHPVLAHVPAEGDPAPVLAAMLSGDRYEGGTLELIGDVAPVPETRESAGRSVAIGIAWYGRHRRARASTA